MKFPFCILIILFSWNAYAEDPLPSEGSTPQPQYKVVPHPTQGGPAQKGAANPNVLDFEADVIEGKRQAPDLFIQQDPGNIPIETILFERKNFNDFLKNEKKGIKE